MGEPDRHVRPAVLDAATRLFHDVATRRWGPALRLPTHLDRDGDAAEQRVSALARRLPRLVGRFVMDELAEAGLTLPDARLMSDAFVTTWQGSVVRVLLGEDGEQVTRELRAWLDHCSNVV